jgi:hypothetical protein
MAEQRTETVQATIVTIGDLVQVTPKFAKASFEYTIGESADLCTADVPRWHRGALEAGSTYELVLKANQTPDGDYYTPSVDEKPILVTGGAVNGAAPKPPAAKPSKKPPPTPAPVVSEQQTPGRRPELNARWVQFSTHSRTAQMQATERVGQYLQLAIAGRLVTDEDEPIKNIKKSTIENWYSEEVDRYWDELDMREPNDVFGNLKDGS